MPRSTSEFGGRGPLPEPAGRPSPADFRDFVDLHCLLRIRTAEDWLATALSDPAPPALRELRVAARRLVNALDSFSTVLDPERTARFRKAGRSMLTTARPTRELDVTLEAATKAGLDPDSSLAALMRVERAAAEQVMAKRLRRKRFKELSARWQRSAGDASTKGKRERKPRVRLAWMPEQSPTENARVVLPPFAGRYFEAGRATCVEGATAKQLHKFRLAGKRLRHCLELFQEVYGPSLEERTAALRDIQRRLGVLTDCVASTAVLRSLDAPDVGTYRELLDSLAKRQSEGAGEFLAHWERHFSTPEVEQEWRDYLAGAGHI